MKAYFFLNITYNLICTTKVNDSSIFLSDYLNLSLANEYDNEVTIPTEVIKYNQNVHHADQPIRLPYSSQIRLLKYIRYRVVMSYHLSN